jgi:pilus assembly protein CpaE
MLANAIAATTRWARRFLRGEDGISSIEFALLAPVLFFTLVATVDVGKAEYQRMTIDHVLRAGAQSAMTDPGVASVRQVVQSVASRNFTLASPGTPTPEALATDIKRYCACPEAPAASVDCLTTCPGSSAANVYYSLSGALDVAGMIMPTIALNPSILVQVR